MQARVMRAGLQVDPAVAAFVEDRLLAGLDLGVEDFWAGLAAVLSALGPENRRLLAVRDRMQAQINGWHRARAGQGHDPAAYRTFLEEIGYLAPEPAPFTIGTGGVDAEIARLAGPQLVVPVTNARFALNAANARWGSLYDALYGTDALGDPAPAGPFDPARGARVVAWVRAHLDRVCPLAGARWADVTQIAVTDGALAIRTAGGAASLRDPGQFAGWLQDELCEWQILLRVNGLLIEILVDRTTPTGGADPAGISDVWVEAALTAIMDCEDSVAAVDGPDKVLAWGNWLGLMKGDLTAPVTKGGQTVLRRLNPDATYHRAGGGHLPVRCRALLWVRNVGHLMTTPAIRDADGREVPEGLLDAVMTVTAALHDRARGEARNSATGAIYLVKPKIHGPEEVALAVRTLAMVEAMLGLPENTVKLGIMDEERRTSVNLAACIRAARDRVAFINTGFLDRTGDEIHTSMDAGPMLPKGEMRQAPWIAAYEARNVEIGLACGLRGRAQIGKGMWASPDRMAAMLAAKGAQLMAGASTAWVPSPTAATLHALHYHQVDVAARMAALEVAGARTGLDALLAIPLAAGRSLTPDVVAHELDNNAQGILGYVVRWVDQGIGCSKVPDLAGEALMEDRATCRISAQAIANWLRHGLVDRAGVQAAFRRMAEVVDRQNAGDPAYRPMAPRFDGPAFRAALALALDGAAQPAGYTEPILHKARAEAKAGAR